ncbi:MAG: acetate--CoA ligase family protein [Nitrospirae bacterium]|nr:acetate--CoA ligase family protein [Nitrospirota bacterium]
MARSSGLDPFFYPRSVAVVGASKDETKPSGIVLKNLLNSFHGRIYPVNPRYRELNGIPCYPSVANIPDDVSLSVFITPPAIIPALLRGHAAKDIHHVIIATAGFGETEGGGENEKEIRNIARLSDIRIIGPNCLGVFHPSVGLDTFFLPYDRVPRPQQGNISVISQSGSILGATMILMRQEGLGVAKAVSYGNRVDVGEPELLEYLSADEDTTVIGICIESVGDGRGFIRAAQGCRKPVVVLKLGQQPAGKRAARSHTGSMAGRYEVFQAAFRRSGVYEARTLEEFLDLLKTFSMRRPCGEGRRVLIVTNAGGIGVMTADLCNREGLDVPDLPPEPKEKLRSLLPPYYSLSNPIDLTGNSTDEDFAVVLRTSLDYFDAAILIPFMTVPGITPHFSEMIVCALHGYKKPVVSLNPFAQDGKTLEESLRRCGVPMFPTPARMVRALAALMKPGAFEPLSGEIREYPGVASILKDIKRGDVKILLDALNLKYPKSIRAKNQTEAVSAALKTGLPVSLYISSPDILHKTDVGGVRLNLRSIKELREGYKEIIKSVRHHMPDARITGIDVEEMSPAGVEIIVGGVRDPHFGPVVMLGLGGIFTELLKDVVFEIAPVTHNGAYRMIESLRGYPVLKGIRGAAAIDVDAVADTIVKVSEVITLFSEIEEIEFNPAIAYPSGLIVVDAKIVMADPA